MKFASWLCNYSHGSYGDVQAQASDQLKNGGQLPGSTSTPFRAFLKLQCNKVFPHFVFNWCLKSRVFCLADDAQRKFYSFENSPEGTK